jgi:hypothetical protein
MVTVVIPVGQFIGTMVTPASDAGGAQWAYGVRVGSEVHDLNESEFALWAMAHGTGDDSVNTASRVAVETLARDLDVEDPEANMDQLLRRGLMRRLLPVSADIRAFTEGHQLMPLGVGLGNSAERLNGFDIGQPGFPRATVNAAVFDVWAFSATQAPSLWQACARAPDWDAEFSQAELAALVVKAVPVLLAMDAAYIDVV